MVNFAQSLDDDSTLYLAVNNLRTRLSANISATDTVIPVLTTSGFPTNGYISILTGTDITKTEAIKYDGKTSNSFTGALRGADGTLAITHNQLDNVDLTIVAEHHNALKDAVVALEHFVGVSGSESFVRRDEDDNVSIDGILTISGVPVGEITTLQDAYDNGTGVIATTIDKNFTVSGTGTFKPINSSVLPTFGDPIFAYQETQKSTNQTSYQDANCETEPLLDGVDYLVIYISNLGYSTSSASSGYARIIFGSTVLGEIDSAKSPLGTIDDIHYNASTLNGIVKITGNGSDTIKFQVRSANSIRVAYLGSMAILALPLDSFTENIDYFYEGTLDDTTEQSNMPTWIDTRSASWSLNAEEYLFMFSTEGWINISTLGRGAAIRYRVNSTTVGAEVDWFSRAVGSTAAGVASSYLLNIGEAGLIPVSVQGNSTGSGDNASFRRTRMFAIRKSIFAHMLSSKDETGFSTSDSSFTTFSGITTTVSPMAPNPSIPIVTLVTSNMYTKDANSAVVGAIRNETDEQNYRIDSGGRATELGGTGSLRIYPFFTMHYETRTHETEYQFMVRSTGSGEVRAGRDASDTGGLLSEMIVWAFNPYVYFEETTISGSLVQTSGVVSDEIDARYSLTISGMPVLTEASLASSNIVVGTITADSGIFNDSLTLCGNPVSTGTSGGTPLTVRTTDSNPSVSNVSMIVVTAGTLIDDGGGQVTIETGAGGGITSSGTTISGIIGQKLDTTHSPVGLWNFEQNLEDSSGNGFDLTVQAGTEAYSNVNGLWGIKMEGTDDSLWYNATGSALQITGDLTVEALVSFDDFTNTPIIVHYHEAATEEESGNGIYSLRANTNSGFGYFAEYGAGNNITYNITDGPVLATLVHVAMVRESNEVTFYLNGLQVGDTSSGLSAPTGGTTSKLQVGYNSFNGIMCSLKILDSALSAAEIYEEFQNTWASAISSSNFGELAAISGTFSKSLTISGIPVSTGTGIGSIIGSDGITVISGSDTTEIQGFYSEFTNASGSLSSEIDSDISTHAAISDVHHPRYMDSEAIIATEPYRTTVSGYLQNQFYYKNVRHYGALGDGVTDDTLSIQNAINDVSLDTTIVPSGIYVVTGLTMNSAGKLILDKGSSLKLKDNTAGNNITVAADNVIICGDGTIDGNRANQVSDSNFGVMTSGSHQLLVDGIYVTGTTAQGIFIQDSNNSTVQRCRIDNTGNTGVYGAASTANLESFVVRDCYIDRSDDPANDGGGIKIHENDPENTMVLYPLVTNCTVLMHNQPTGDYVVGVEYWGDVRFGKINNCTVSGASIGISVANGSSSCVVANSNVIDSDGIGIELVDCTSCMAVGNSIEGSLNPATGLVVDGSGLTASGNALIGNFVRGATSRNIYVYYDAVYTTVAGNTTDTTYTNAAGIQILKSSHLSLTGNVISGNALGNQAILVNNGSDITIQGNVIRGWKRGVQLVANGENHDYVDIGGNVVRDTTINSVLITQQNEGTYGNHVTTGRNPGYSYGSLELVECLRYTESGHDMVFRGVHDQSPENSVTAEAGSFLQIYGIANPASLGFFKSTTSGNTGWLPVQVINYGATGSRPTGLGAAGTGFNYFDTGLGQPIWWNGSAWVTASGSVA